MAKASLILLAVILAGCVSTEKRMEEAAVTQGQTQAKTPLPTLDASCSAKTGRVVPKADEPRVVTLKRWEVVADNRDRQASDCDAWYSDLSQRWGK